LPSTQKSRVYTIRSLVRTLLKISIPIHSVADDDMVPLLKISPKDYLLIEIKGLPIFLGLALRA
jgi:hypothetical protein